MYLIINSSSWQFCQLILRLFYSVYFFRLLLWRLGDIANGVLRFRKNQYSKAYSQIFLKDIFLFQIVCMNSNFLYSIRAYWFDTFYQSLNLLLSIFHFSLILKFNSIGNLIFLSCFCPNYEYSTATITYRIEIT